MSSRRLLTVALVSLVTLLAAPRGAEADRKYNPSCIGRRDDAKCGPCQTCLDEVCVLTCSRCEDCHNGKCQPRPPGSLCLGDCGTCQGGVCLPSNQVCFTRNPCKACSSDFTCVDGREGDLCQGDCGVCVSGACSPDVTVCDDPRCQNCEANSFTCRADSEGLPCEGNCGTCVSGACSPDGQRCPRCQECDVNILTCIPKPEGDLCQGDCGTCQDGLCLGDGELCPACTICEDPDFACTPFPEDDRCAGECCNEECVACEEFGLVSVAAANQTPTVLIPSVPFDGILTLTVSGIVLFQTSPARSIDAMFFISDPLLPEREGTRATNFMVNGEHVPAVDAGAAPNPGNVYHILEAVAQGDEVDAFFFDSFYTDNAGSFAVNGKLCPSCVPPPVE